MRSISKIIVGLSIAFCGLNAANARSATDAEVKMLSDATNNYATALKLPISMLF